MENMRSREVSRELLDVFLFRGRVFFKRARKKRKVKEGGSLLFYAPFLGDLHD
jgi:hypothetical protein